MDDAPLLDAARYLDAYGFDTTISGGIMVVFDQRLVPARPWWNRAIGARNHPFRALGTSRDGIDIVASGPGAPVAGVTLELAAAMGAERVVTIGTGASLDTAPTGTVVAIERAAPDTQLARTVSPNPALTAELRRHAGAAVAASTDAPFRQNAVRLGTLRDAGATIVEMECATLFETGSRIGVAVASLVVTSDRYETDRWVPGDERSVRFGLEEARAIALEALHTTDTPTS
ncbi:MAG: hypothetical protein AAF567_12680 [Actinomycetota bacterium]